LQATYDVLLLIVLERSAAAAEPIPATPSKATMKIKEAAEYLGVSKSAMYEMVRDGRI
jgi:hypothetical protein